MPIQVQCCGLVLMLILLYSYRSQKKVELNTERAFWRAFCMTILCISFDILSCVVIVYREQLPDLLVQFICKTYLVTLVGVSFFALMYICADIYTRGEMYKRVVKRYSIFVLLGVILIYALPIHYYYDKNRSVLYTYGPSDLATYAFALGTLLMLLTLLWKERTRISAARREAVLIWMGVWICAALIQFFNSTLLLVGYASAVGMIVLYLKLENPEMNLDRKTGLFNHSAFLQYARQLYDKGGQFSVLAVIFDRSFYKSIRAEIEEAVNMEIIEYLSKIPDALAFKNAEGEVLLLFTDENRAEDGMRMVRKRFEEKWGKDRDVLVYPYWIYIPETNVVDNVEDLFHLMHYVRNNSKEFAENCFLRVDEKLASEMYREKEVEQLIINAIENDWVEVYYQPIYSTEERRFTAAEALVRIKDGNGKIISPGVFIDVAENNGMILRLGEMVFEKVCRFIRENQIRQYGLQYIEVNLSVIQCAYEQLADDYIRIMEENGLSPDLINLEITESASVSAKKTLLDNMQSLMNYGVRFSLDDFGTGQSNLNYIVDMPVDIVKFDRSMINAYFENGKAKYVMDAAMHMIHGMDLEIVSEGIETKEQYQTMEGLGISYIQGFYFSKPLPEREFLTFISGGQSRAVVSVSQ